jgi:hypothetical protein
MSEEINKVDGIIKSINELSDAEKRELTIKVRTTNEGIKAYTSFLYGHGGLPLVDNDNNPPVPDSGNSTNANDQNAKESQDNNNQEDEQHDDWL